MQALKLLATGKALPEGSVSSDELDQRLGHPPGYVKRKSGVDRRYHADLTLAQSDLAAAALRHALQLGHIDPHSVDLLISASGVPEQALPCTATRIHHAAGLKDGTPAFDVNASCLGFLNALQVAASLLNSGDYRRIAIVASDLPSRGLDWADPDASLIFGDGAAAAVVESGDGRSGIVSCRFETYPIGREYCEIRAGGTRRNPRAGVIDSDYLFRMDGRRLFRLSSRVMTGFLERLFARSALGPSDMDLVIPHQASHLAMEHIRRRLGLPGGALIDIYARHGNQVAASIPTALHEAVAGGRAVPGSRLLLLGTAAGLTVGGMVLIL
jgi:3-oxoacyl-[acyl-carrier-protein] synthase-3